jgi:hypothetical protein
MRREARGGHRAFGAAVDEYDDLLAAIEITRELPLRDVTRASGLSITQVRRLRRQSSPPRKRPGS